VRAVQNPFLIGPTVYLRPLEPQDAPTLTPWFNDAEVNRFMLRSRPMSVVEEEAFLRRMAESDSDVLLGIVLRENDRLVGGTGFHKIDARNRHASFGITIGAKDLWSKGLGSEATRLMVGYAFGTLNLNRVWLEVYEYNPRAVRVYEKIGFRVEGRLRQDTFRDGRYWDTLLMGILRDEWRDG
jgi:RimJ/RimL family protein N-acetyltransferase